MNADFDRILDECIDRMNSGERLEDCLAGYPEHAEALEPLLRVMLGAQMAHASIPSPMAKRAARLRFNAAREELERKRGQRQPLLARAPGWSRAWAAAATVILIALVGYFGLRPVLSPIGPGGEPGAEGNFALLISDDVNAIADFEHLYVTISSIGVQQGGEPGEWTQFPPDIEEVDLTLLQGDRALEIWRGDVSEGPYTKVFIYVSGISGILKETGLPASVKLPSEKLQITKPFVVAEDLVTSFVYDIAVLAAGRQQDRVEYILKPEITESGAHQEFEEVTPPGKPKDKLQTQLVGDPEPGAEVTLIVTDDGAPLEGATVTVDGKGKGSTGVDGSLTFELPAPAHKVKIKARLGDKQGELKIKLEKEQEAQLEWFEGTITAISEGGENGSPWTMALRGIRGSVTVHVVELEGAPSIGAKAEIKGVLKDNVITAAEAEIEEQKEKAERFEGTITAISEGEEKGSPWTMSLRGIRGSVTVHVVELEGAPSMGAKAEVKGVLKDNVIWDAKVEVYEPGDNTGKDTSDGTGDDEDKDGHKADE